MYTIKDIAKLAGVSRGTVDRVLNNRGSVNAETAERIRKIAEAVNYTPSPLGKTLALTKKQLKFGYLLFSSTDSNPFFLDVVRGIQSTKKTLASYGVRVEIRYSEIDNPELQVQLIDELVDCGINGLVITPINHELVKQRLLELTRSGVPVITANSDIEDCGRIAYVGDDYIKSGRTAAGLINLACHDGAQVGIVTGSPLVLCHSMRIEGFTKSAKNSYPNIKIVDTAVNYDDDLKSYAQTTAMLNQHPEIDVLYLVAGGVNGACSAVKDLGLDRKIKIFCHDVTTVSRKLIREGVITAAIAQQPFKQGEKPLMIMLDLLGMDIQPKRKFNYTNIEIIIKENLK